MKKPVDAIDAWYCKTILNKLIRINVPWPHYRRQARAAINALASAYHITRTISPSPKRRK